VAGAWPRLNLHMRWYLRRLCIKPMDKLSASTCRTIANTAECKVLSYLEECLQQRTYLNS
jgi:hypothetical protein